MEDEKVRKYTEWGIENHPGMSAPSHSDGICLNLSIWLDGGQVLEEGKLTRLNLQNSQKNLRNISRDIYK